MEVAGLFRGRCRAAAELLHPVDEFRDPVHLARDQFRKRTVALVRAAFEQLAGAADRGEGVLDFMRQHGGSAQFDALVPVVVALALADLGKGQHAPAWMRGNRRASQIDAPVPRFDSQDEVACHELRFGVAQQRGDARFL